jgi:transposase InsO family protein
VTLATRVTSANRPWLIPSLDWQSYHRKFVTRAETRTALFDYIESFYNCTRLHSSLGYLSPITFESQLN